MTEFEQPDPLEAARAELLGRVLDGELDRDSEEVRAYLERDPEFAQDLDELLTLDAECGADFVPRDVVDDPEPWQGADQKMRELVAPPATSDSNDTATPATRRLFFPMLMAAAVIIAGAIWWAQHDPRTPASPDTLLHSADGLWPHEETPRAELLRRGFEWSQLTASLPLAEFTVTIEGAGGPWTSEPSEERRWLDQDVVRALPETFTWTLTARATGRALGSWSTSVTLR